jgi:Asp-tRNA(Asn)/Glu-tRNA(Gln) amidotransferase A subunit family amidase
MENLKLEVAMLDYQLIESLRTDELALPEYLAQVQAWFDEREPSVLAFVPEPNRFERLQREAEALLSRFPDPENRPPLFGMLVGAKDNFHIDGFVTQAGTRLPVAEIQGSEAESVTKLKNAGALILGKTVTTEFAYFAPGPTRNPYNPENTPGVEQWFCRVGWRGLVSAGAWHTNHWLRHSSRCLLRFRCIQTYL